MKKVKCPIKGCKGYQTCSDSPNLMNHIKNCAKTELLIKHLFDGGAPHADYLKNNYKMIVTESCVYNAVTGSNYIVKDKKIIGIKK